MDNYAGTAVAENEKTVKIAVYGRGENIHRVASVLSDPAHAVELHDNLPSFVEASKSAHLLMIDCTDPANLDICRELASNSTPVIAIIDSRYDGWQQSHDLNITGYISVNTSDNEIAARLGAMLRFSMYKKKIGTFSGGAAIPRHILIDIGNPVEQRTNK